MDTPWKAVRLNNIHDLLYPLISGKRLLDVGCIGHDFEWRRQIGTFYYADFQKVAGELRGIDILSEDVERAHSEGYRGVEVGDAETSSMKEITMSFLLESLLNT